jgi:HlyD family secretion protein
MTKRYAFALFALFAIMAAAGGGYLYWQKRTERLPEGIVWGNGRIEADDLDITPKFGGRVTELLVDEGDMVSAGQVLARMDTRGLGASLRKAEALIQEARKNLEDASGEAAHREAQLRLADQEYVRAQQLAQKTFASVQVVDQRRAERDSAKAQFASATARIGKAEQAIEAARREAERIRIDIAEGTLVTPRDGRVLYRLVSTGEVVPSGAKIFTLLDLTNVYMTVFLPTKDAGKAAIGTEARIVVDAYPRLVIPAKVTFVAAKSQFTPKNVETRSERDKLMFRVKVQIDRDLIAKHAADVRTGLPGVAYVRVDPRTEWPRWLQINLPQ